MTRECHAGILREPGGWDSPGHPTSVLCQRSSVSDKFEFIDAEYAVYQESGEQQVPSIVKMCTWREVSRSGFLQLAGHAGIGDGEKARDTRAVREKIIRGFR